MPSIEARISNDLKFNESGEIGINIDDSKDDNALALKSDGLFLNGNLVGSNDGFVDGNYGNMRIGFASGYDKRPDFNESGLVTANNIVHRTFTFKTVDGQTVSNFRPEVDCYIPGDIIRVQQADETFEYRLVIKTTTGPDPNSKTGNSVPSLANGGYVVLGTW